MKQFVFLLYYLTFTGTSIRTTVSWSWPVRLRKTLTLGRPPSSEPEFIPSVSR